MSVEALGPADGALSGDDVGEEHTDAVSAFSALAHHHRLLVFRMLVRQGSNGMPAGEIARRLSIVPSTLSRHLAQLERAGLLRSWRIERNVFYAVDIEGTRRLVAFLTEDCCQGHPELCGYRSTERCR